MIWIATLCLLAIAAWLFFNALNERRWVEAHSHDETVAADPGILPDFSKMTASLRSDAGGKVSIDQEDTRFARAVAKVRETTDKAAQKIERQAAAARERDDGETFFGRAVTKVGDRVRDIDERLDARAKRAAEGRSGSVLEEDSLLGRTVARVSRREERQGERIRSRAATKAGTDRPAGERGADDGFFGRMVDRVSGGLERVDGKLDAKARRSHAADDDLLMRASAKVGGRVNEVEDRIVDKSKDAAQWVDKKTDL